MPIESICFWIGMIAGLNLGVQQKYYMHRTIKSITPMPSPRKVPSRSEIRSRHFCKRFMPKVNFRDIPTHNIFGVTMAERDWTTQTIDGPAAWTSVHQKNSKAHSSHKPQRNPEIERSVVLLRKYLSRKDKRNHGRDVPDLLALQPDAELTLREETARAENIRARRNRRNNYLMDDEFSIPGRRELNTDMSRQMRNFGTSKSLHEMTHEELEQSIKWKKQFLTVLTAKLPPSTCSTLRTERRK